MISRPSIRRFRCGLAWILTIAAAGWALALVAATYCAAGCGSGRTGVFPSATVYVLCSQICHQHADRSFVLWGTQMPVCARCTGLYVGGALGALIGLATAYRRQWRRLQDRSIESLGVWRGGLMLAAAPTAVTIALEFAFSMGVTNAARAWAAVPLGAVVGWIVASSLRGREHRADELLR